MMNNTPKYYNKVCTYFVSQDIKYNWEGAFQIDFNNHLVFPSCAFYTLLDSKKNMSCMYLIFDRKIKSTPNLILNSKRLIRICQWEKCRLAMLIEAFTLTFTGSKLFLSTKIRSFLTVFFTFWAIPLWFQNHSTVLYKYVKIEKVCSYVLHTW